MVQALAKVVGVGMETADMLVREVLSRDLRDRRERWPASPVSPARPTRAKAIAGAREGPQPRRQRPGAPGT